jgi:UDP-N-acetylenolpyruvoylglucosamine reductase
MGNAVIIMRNSDHWKSLNWIGDNTLHCASRVSFRDFCKSLSEKQFLGTEKHAYIAGHQRGAIFMNPGSHGRAISDHLIFIEILDQGGLLYTMEKSSLDFGYRLSSIPRDHIILGATFQCNGRAPG